MKNLFLKLIIPTIVIGCTLLLIYYAKGYRFDLVDNTFIKTGIVHVETQPTRANYWLTEDFTGRTPRIISSVPEGEYVLDIWLDGYHGIKYDIEVFAERSTPLSVFLFKEEPEVEIAQEIEGEILQIHTSKGRNNVLIFVEREAGETQRNYEILKYQTNTKFWQLGNNPSTIFTFSIGLESEITDISVSPNDKNILLTIIGQDSDDLELLPTGKHIISLDTKTTLAEVSDIVENFKWSHDGETLIWENDQGINKLNLKEPETPVLVYTPQEDTEILYYDSYTNGEIYLLLKEESEQFVSLARIDTNLEETFLIENIYYQTEERFLEEFRESEIIEYKPFTNSPQSTLFVGEPETFLISREHEKIIFNTEFASYLYDIEKDKYVLINPYQSEILDFSPDGEKLSFLSLENEKLGFFIFEKETSNYSIELGGGYTADYINREDCHDFAWHQNSNNIYYSCENSLYVTDIRTDININLVREFGGRILLGNSKQIVTINEEENSLEIVEYTVN